MTQLPKAILFDHDGVLVASEPLHWAAWGKLLNELGIPYDSSEIRMLVGKTAPEIMRELLDRYHPGWNPAEFDLTDLARRKNDFYLASAKTELKTYPGVIEGLKWLKAKGVRTAVVSNSKHRELDTALETLGVAPYMDLVISRDDVSAPKPDPAPYLFAASSLGIEPHSCLAVEDSPPGLEAALRARIPTAAVETNFARALLEQPVPGRPDLRPDWIGKSMQELFDWLVLLCGC